MIRFHCDCCGKDTTDDKGRVHIGADPTRLFLDGKGVSDVNLCARCYGQTKNDYDKAGLTNGEIHYKSQPSATTSGMQWLLRQLQLSEKIDALWAVRNAREKQAVWCEFDQELNQFLDETEKTPR